ncbi:DNRLRE domain-containing protein [Streptomyces sp. NPDC057403]|uniref:DNRLRE domain-containing protein n=1 Tax=Streptomyces sp. NPDC057403 TaxID=3346119 RepID=UPI00368D375B
MAAETALIAENSGLGFAAALAAPVAQPAAAASASAKMEGAAEAQDEASAALMARLQDRKIEVLSDRTTESTTYALPSGELETEAYAGPVRVKEGGDWKDVDTSLSDTGADLTPAVTAADITVSDGGDTKLASVTKGDESFGLGWESKLPTPSVKDDTASYDLGDGQKLSVTALVQGFSENIKLTQQPDDGAASYRIPLNLDGLKLSQADSGHLLLKDSDGKLIAEAPAPMMWDASKDEASGESAHQQRVDTKIETADDGSQTLVLTPDKDFLSTATYPITVDPTSTLAVTTDTWVQNPDYPDSQVSSQELKSGTYDSGTDTARSYLKFDVSKFTGKHITAATMSLYNYYSSTCSTSGAATQARRITSTWSSSSITWGAQPSTTTTGVATNTGHWGYSSSCPAAWSNWNLQTITQAWADGSTNYGLQIRSADETDSTTWRRFRSANYTTSGYAPKLVVTYNTYATTSALAISPSSVNAYSGKRYVTTYTPTLSAKVTDADGSNVKAQFEITNDPSYAGETSYSYTGTSSSVASGSTATLAIPSASQLAAAHLRMRVRGYDGTDYGAWSSYIYFVPNVAKPNAPAVSCDPYGEQSWTAKASDAVTCTLDTSSSDGQGYLWGLDDSSTPESVYDTADGNGGDPLTVGIRPAEGWHTLYARTVDSGGNLSSSVTAYAFGVGDGASVVSPKDGITTARRATLKARGLSSYTKATWYYRLGDDGDWSQIPASDVTASDGSGVTWPVAMTDGQSAAVIWNVADTVGVDTGLQVRASLAGDTSSAYSSPVSLALDRAAGQGPTKNIGPGTVNLLTGTYTITEKDVDVLGAQVTRTAASRTSSNDEPDSTIFGPGWAAGDYADVQDATYAKVVKKSSTAVQLVSSDGETTADFTYSGSSWTSADADDVTLSGATDGNTFTLTDAYGTVATYTLSGTSGTWLLDTVAHLDDDSEVTVSQAVFSGDSVSARPKYVLTSAKPDAADDCYRDMTSPDCRIVEYIYPSSTTATNTAYGDYTGRVSKILIHVANPGATQISTTAVAAYAYDATGHLRQAWDPRISPSLKTTYGYDSSDRVTSYGPPGQRTWNFTYAHAGKSSAAGEGMLTRASRAGATGDPDTGIVSLIYDVPLTGSSAPYEMSSTEVGKWGQQTVPVDATAVFPPDSVPAGNAGSLLGSGDYTKAEIEYVDAEGCELNSVTQGGHMATKEYDSDGNVVRELSAANRELALGTAANADTELALLQISGESTAVRAQRLSTVTTYDSGGRPRSESGPLHMIQLQHDLGGGVAAADLSAGDQTPARKHTTYAYDEGRPSSATASGLITTTTVGAQVTGYPNDGDVTVTTATYDWDTGNKIKETTDPTGLALATTTSYTSDGKVSTTAAPGNTVATTTYWTATGTGTCAGHPEWTGLVCQSTTSAASDTSKAKAVTKTFTYDRWGNRAKQVQTSGTTDRTTTYTYDDAGRLTLTHVTSSTGTALTDQTVTYNTDNGKKATVSRDGKTAKYTYDQLSRLTTYVDGTGNSTTTAYDGSDRPTSVTDSTSGTTSYVYSTTDSGDPVVKMTDSGAGTFTFTYGTDGRLLSENLPSNNTLKVSYNELGLVTQRLYTSSDDTTELLSAATYTVGDDIAHEARTAGTTVDVDYAYDRAGRMTKADENAADSTCTTRAYALDSAGNRTSVSTTTSTCADPSSATTTKDTYGYNAQNQLTATGYAYNALGDTTDLADGTQLTYYADGSPTRLTLGDNRETWTQDAEGRPATAVTESKATGSWAAVTTVISHYADGNSAPAWSTDGTTTHRYLKDPQGNLVATVDNSTTTLQLADVQGDIAVTVNPADATAAVHSYTDTGATSSSLRYGWLGQSTQTDHQLAGIVLVAGHFYTPALGRYLTPLEARGDEEVRVNPYLFAPTDLVE